MLNTEHECDYCGNYPSKDTCYCEACYDSKSEEAYESGKEAGHKEGYEEARREFEKLP